MAKLKVSAGLIEGALFGEAIDVSIDGAIYDPATEVVTFDISGKDVPDADEVIGEVTEEARTERVRRTRLTALTPA